MWYNKIKLKIREVLIMAFIPTRGLQKGDKVVLKHDHTSMSGKFEAGTEVTIIGKGDFGYDIIDDEGHRMVDCGWDL